MKVFTADRLISALVGVVVLAAIVIALLPAGRQSQPSPPTTPFPTSSQFNAILVTLSDLEIQGLKNGFDTLEVFRAAVAKVTSELSVADTLDPWKVYINPNHLTWTEAPTINEAAILCRHPNGRGVFVMTFGQSWFIAPEGDIDAPWMHQAIRPK